MATKPKVAKLSKTEKDNKNKSKNSDDDDLADNMGSSVSKTVDNENKVCPSDDVLKQPLYKLCIPIITGYAFGFVMEKGRVFEPVVIRDMMVLRNFTMLKMFLSALSTSMLSMFIVSTISKRRFFACSEEFYASLKSKSVLSSIVGGLMIGVGMPICGSCPTSVFTQLGAFVPNAQFTLYGGILATYAYTWCKPKIDAALRPSTDETSNPWESTPYPATGLLIAMMFVGITFALETLLPWTDVVVLANSGKTVFAYNAWPPWVSGLVIGSLQVPLMLAIGQTLGGTSSLLTLCSMPLIGPLSRFGSCFLHSYRTKFSNWWQVFYVASVAGGAFTSAHLSGQLGTAVGINPGLAFGGGFLLMFGSRIAGGCTSGHGITGMAMMSILSVLTTACMFGGGMITGVVMKYGLDLY